MTRENPLLWESKGKQLDLNEEGTPILKFPLTEAGSTSSIMLDLTNTGKYYMELIPFSEDPDIKFPIIPKGLDVGETGTLVVEFSPNKLRWEPLTGNWGVKCVIGGAKK